MAGRGGRREEALTGSLGDAEKGEMAGWADWEGMGGRGEAGQVDWLPRQDCSSPP